MPSYSKIGSLLGVALAIHKTQATVVVPYVAYIPYQGYELSGVPKDWVRYNSDGPYTDPDEVMYSGRRFGIHVEVGTPAQHVFLTPNFYDAGSYINNVTVCELSDLVFDQSQCEMAHNGLFAANESSSWESGGGEMGTDNIFIFDSFPDLRADDFGFSVGNASTQNFVINPDGFLGLGPGSTFIERFFPGKEQIGIYFPGNSSTPKIKPTMPPNPTVIYELEFDGYNQSHFAGERFTEKIPSTYGRGSDPPHPFMLNVTGLQVGGIDILQGQSYMAVLDLYARETSSFPEAVYERFGRAVNATAADDYRGLEIATSALPTDPAKMMNLTMKFSNGHSITIPQDFLFLETKTNVTWPLVTNQDRQPEFTSQLYQAPVISGTHFFFSSYMGIDWAANEFFVARGVHPWDEEFGIKSTAAPSLMANVGNMPLYLATLAAAYVLFG